MFFFLKKKERKKEQKGQVSTRATDTQHAARTSTNEGNQHTSHQGQGQPAHTPASTRRKAPTNKHTHHTATNTPLTQQSKTKTKSSIVTHLGLYNNHSQTSHNHSLWSTFEINTQSIIILRQKSILAHDIVCGRK